MFFKSFLMVLFPQVEEFAPKIRQVVDWYVP